MGFQHEHEYDCKHLLGQPWTEVHQWLDELFAEYGPAHRCHRHHTEGIDEVRRMWGDEAALAAKIHILVDCWGIPSQADYENGFVDTQGYAEGATLEEAKAMLRALLADH